MERKEEFGQNERRKKKTEGRLKGTKETREKMKESRQEAIWARKE